MSRSESRETTEGRILVCVTRTEAMTLAALVEAGANWSCQVAEGVDEIRSKVLDDRYEVVVIPACDFDESISADIRRLQPNASVVVVAATARVEEVTRTMRLGASDFLPGDLDADQVEDRLVQAIERSRALVTRDRVAHRLAELGGRIEPADEPISMPVEDAVGDVDDVMIDDDSGRVAMCSEFRTLLRQELDVEDLLRTALEYLLVKTGPTNAAVFLAGGDGRFGLGAYVNYEHPRRSVEPMLQRLADEACPRLSSEEDILRFDDANEFIADCELETTIEDGLEMIAVPCLHEGECLAILYMFRGGESTFSDSVGADLDALRGILADQLATLIRIHNRMEDAWPEEPEDDWDDMAA
ncbi:MAG: hypothetical protein CMJ34_05390 [Phycisphaerae bacterium]|nr:hypothetical protein [Phycisphaerae bacterium]